MTDETDYRPSPTDWVRDQVEAILAAGTTRAASIMDREVVLVTMVGAKTGAKRLVPLMRVEHDGVYAAVGSKGGAPQDPLWVANLRAHPEVTLQDGTVTHDVVARQATPDEREQWWPRCVAAYPPYADYQTKTDRVIPVFLLEPR